MNEISADDENLLSPTSHMKRIAAGGSYAVAFLVSAIVISPVVGALFGCFDLPWGAAPVIGITLLALLFASRTAQLFMVRSRREALSLILLGLAFVIVFRSYAPVLEIRQDPGVNLMKAFNLINHGHYYRPMGTLTSLLKDNVVTPDLWQGYGKLENGAEFHGNGLRLDFYDGGSSFFAYLGSFKRPLALLAPLAVTFVGLVVLFFLVLKLFGGDKPLTALSLVSAFMLSPAFVWFGRAPYSENSCFLVFMLILLLLDNSARVNTSWRNAFLMVVFISGYLTRIDYLLVLFVGVVVFTSLSSWAGAVFTLLSLAAIQLASHTFPIYYELNQILFFKYDSAILVALFVASLVSFKVLRIEIKKWVESPLSVGTLGAVLCFVLLFMFRNNLQPYVPYQIESIHGYMIRNYNEETIDRLFTVYPAMMFVLGFLALPLLLKEGALNVTARACFVGVLLPFLYYLYRSGNSPQLYWNLRRYVYVILPSATLGYAFFVSTLRSREQRMLVSASLILALNIYLNANQIVDFKGLDFSVRNFLQHFDEDENLLLYPAELKYEVSSVISYGKYDFMPVTDLATLENAINKSSRPSVIYVTRKAYPIPFKEVGIHYQTMGLNYDGIPMDGHGESYPWKIYNASELLEAVKAGRVSL